MCVCVLGSGEHRGSFLGQPGSKVYALKRDSESQEEIVVGASSFLG